MALDQVAETPRNATLVDCNRCDREIGIGGAAVVCLATKLKLLHPCEENSLLPSPGRTGYLEGLCPETLYNDKRYGR